MTVTAQVLIVEDEGLLAIALADILADAGFEVVGPAANVDHALALLAKHGCQIAVLDVNLRDETSEPVARELAARRTPFLFLSGIAADHAPPWVCGVPFLPKPVRAKELLSAVFQSLEENK